MIDAPPRYRLNPLVELRLEPFGALAYHFGNRRLSFLKTPQLVAVVRALEAYATVTGALDAAGVPEAEHPAYLRALRALADSEVLECCDAPR
ncbi:MAG: mycofactocin biosynthesis chaperone MftB [Egibacteraceae bacterium]